MVEADVLFLPGTLTHWMSETAYTERFIAVCRSTPRQERKPPREVALSYGMTFRGKSRLEAAPAKTQFSTTLAPVVLPSRADISIGNLQKEHSLHFEIPWRFLELLADANYSK